MDVLLAGDGDPQANQATGADPDSWLQGIKTPPLADDQPQVMSQAGPSTGGNWADDFDMGLFDDHAPPVRAAQTSSEPQPGTSRSAFSGLAGHGVSSAPSSNPGTSFSPHAEANRMMMQAQASQLAPSGLPSSGQMVTGLARTGIAGGSHTDSIAGPSGRLQTTESTSSSVERTETAGPSGASRPVLRMADRSQAVTPELLVKWMKASESKEIVYGSLVKFAASHGVNVGTLSPFLNKSGLTLRGEQRLAEAGGHKFAPVTRDIVLKWTAKLPGQRSSPGELEKFASDHNVRLSTLDSYVVRNNEDGLTPDGRELLNRRSKHENAGTVIDAVHDWQAVHPEDRTKPMVHESFAEHYGVNFSSLRQYTVKDNESGLNLQGEQLLQKAAGYQFDPVTSDVLDEWTKIPRKQRSKTGALETFVRKHNLSITSLNKHAVQDSESGLSLIGQQLLQKAAGHQFDPVKPDILRAWQARLSDECKKPRAMENFAIAHNMYLNSLKQYITRNSDDGLTGRGRRMLDRADRS
ncbi:hypothetical protein [Brucella anthropi]|uniref:hypothetical protein n=1 Tax=Brucella anthropi TaxID=529 RepID=UPI00384E911A